MDERLEAEGEVADARLAIDGGDLRHAAAHIGNALTVAPQHADAYEALAEPTVAAGGHAAALELFPTDEPYIGRSPASPTCTRPPATGTPPSRRWPR